MEPQATAAQPVLKQLLGVPPSFECCHAMVKHPHPQRHDPERRAALLDPANFGWHRGMRPKWGIVDSDLGPDLKTTTFLNNISYFTDVETELDGGTAMLDGSHLTDTGDSAEDIRLHMEGAGAQRITSIKAGSVVHFT